MAVIRILETMMKRKRNDDETQANPNNNDNNYNNEIIISFENFFDEYHKITKLKKSDKEASFKKWKQLNKSEQKKALDNIQNYYDSLSDKKYCKKARTYLNDKNFNDEFSAPLFPVITDVKPKITNYNNE